MNNKFEKLKEILISNTDKKILLLEDGLKLTTQPFIKIGVKLLDKVNGKKPTKKKGDIGWDIYSNEEFTIMPGERHTFTTGIALDIPDGYAILLWDRSGLSSNKGIHRLAGVIDSSYKGELKVCLVNLSQLPAVIKIGDRIVQGIIQKEIETYFEEVDELAESERGSNGFGSTGN